MPDFNEQLKKVAAARSVAEQAGQALYKAKIAAQKTLKSTSFADLQTNIGTSFQANQAAQNALKDALNELFPEEQAHVSLTENLQAALPILLFPVHLETRFFDVPEGGGKRQLLVRIYPDDIHVHTHETLLTPKEITAGEDYWRALTAANRQNNVNLATEAKQTAWKHLCEIAGPQRAIWIAKSTQPSNWNPTLAVADSALIFPTHPETKDHSWTMAPHTQLLPDRFVVSIYGPSDRFDFPGNTIPDTIYLGPDPFYADKAYEKIGDEIVPHVDVAWMHDFDKAVEIGLALRIDVDPEFFNAQGVIPKIAVTGLLFSADPEKSKLLTEQMIENHYYARNGFSLVAQGTPTNNTEKDGSGYTRNEDLQALGYFDGVPTALPDDADSLTMASLLGIAPDLLREVPNADLRENAEARTMNTALYPATLGYYFERHLSPLLNASGAAKIRNFFLEHVSARGPFPAFRVGDQPYGLLLTSDQRNWTNKDGEDVAFLSRLNAVLSSLYKIWNEIVDAEQVAYVGNKVSNSAGSLIEVMALQAGSVSYKQRLAATHDALLAIFGPENNIYNTAISQKENLLKTWFSDLGIDATIPANSTLNPPVTSLYLEEKEARLLDKNFVSAKPGAALKGDYINWLADVKTIEELQLQEVKEELKAPNQLLFLLLRHALLLEILNKSVQFFEHADVKVKAVLANKGLFNLAPTPEHKDLTQFELLNGKPKILDAQKFAQVGEQSIGDFLLDKNNNIPDTAGIKAIRASLLELAKWPVSKLERALSNHIDLCFYRLDAWQTGLFHHKLQENRKAHPNGLYIGAYGWVTDLKPEIRIEATAAIPARIKPQDGTPVYKQAENAGFIHTPSLNHASAMGLLLSGYSNHKKNYGSIGAKQPQPFAVNLSSERVRRAKFIFEGVQNGQSLDVLLGYQFERALHDRSSADLENLNLNQYIYDLRTTYPVTRENIPQQGSAKVLETVSAYPVVNGLKLIEALDFDAQILLLVNAANPGNQPAIVARRAKHIEALTAVKKELENTLDAANDLLMAETAYQVVQGNNDRAVSVLNALKDADVPPDIQVVKTPRSSVFGFTNRSSVHFRTDTAGQAGNNWPPETSPRARMETGLNRWLGQCLGNPKTILCEAAFLDENNVRQKVKTISLDELKMQPIDFVMIVGGEYKNNASELEGRIARAYRAKAATDPDDATISIALAAGATQLEERTFAEIIPLARALRTLITTAKPASARDFQGQQRVETKNVADLYGYDLNDLQSRVENAMEDLRKNIFLIEGKQPNETDPLAPSSFKILFEEFFEDGKNPGFFENITLSENGLIKVSQFLRDASLFGIGLAYPDDVSGKNQPDLLAKAAAVWKQITDRLKNAEALLTKNEQQSDQLFKIEQLRKAGKMTLGDDFPVLPRFRYTNGEELRKSIAEQTQLLKHICAVDATTDELALESWMQSTVHVRPELEKLERVRILVEATGGAPINIDAAQTPYRPKDSWLAVEFPVLHENTGKPFNIEDDTIALSLFGEAYELTNELQSAFIVDEWTETIPTEKEVTGIAYHYNQPNAVPPQSLLLAVEPEGKDHWTWDALLGVIENTLQRAKARAVEPSHITKHPTLKHLLPMTLSEFDVQDANVSLDFAIANDDFLNATASDLPLYKPYK
ncbi:MAG: hypothetical protein NW218_11310 [Saprospiraceae bacterium]|nr:hypothetical protein [Saprospiraceae bacterium]